MAACVVVVSFVAYVQWPRFGWHFGLLGGVALTLLMVLWETPPAWIENWSTGADGEKKTARTLRALESQGWVVLHDLQADRGNVDHIAIGPTGVYLLDSKMLGGEVEVSPSTVVVRRIDDPELTYEHTGTGHLVRLAAETHDRIRATHRLSIWICPVMVVWSPFPERVVEQNRCAYVHGDELVRWLLSRKPAIAESRLPQVAAAVGSAWQATATVSSRRP